MGRDYVDALFTETKDGRCWTYGPGLSVGSLKEGTSIVGVYKVPQDFMADGRERVELLAAIRDVSGRKVWGESLPCPKPEPKGEMVERMLIGYRDDWRENSITNLLDKNPYDILQGKRVLIGTYLVPKEPQLTQMNFQDILATIRAAGGKCLAGLPLPEKVVETFPFVRRTQGTSYPYACSQCGNGYAISTPDRCPTCNSLLKGEVPWDPTAYKNKEC